MNSDSPARPRRGPAVAAPLPISIAVHAQLLRRLVEDFVSIAYRIERLRLQPQFQRVRRSVFPRQVVMYLLHVVGGLTLTDIGDLYGVNRRTVAHACVTIEDARDERRLDLVLDLLEKAIIACFQRGRALPLRRQH